MEIWKDIIGFEGLYQISNFGRIKTLANSKKKKSKDRKFTFDKDGYKIILLSRHGKKFRFLIHRLVLSTFVGKSNLQCNHKNGIKFDNRLENLEWVTASENRLHAFKTGLQKALRGEKCKTSKLKEKDVLWIRENDGLIRRKIMAEKFNINVKTISDIIIRKNWRHL